MKRLTILVLYDKNGVFREEISFLLDQLRTVSSRIICIVNGIIEKNCMRQISKQCDDFVVRENKGMDAEAYKAILLDYLQEGEARNYDEIIFCNDTFFGPFEPMCDIFAKMEKKNCDFWGISYYDDWIEHAIHSYFLVFRAVIVNNDELTNFFRDVMKDSVHTYLDAIFMFERGLFDYLIGKHYSYAAYMNKLEFNLYNHSNLSLELGYPILKKKAFAKEHYNYDVIMCCLKIIAETTHYNLDYIINYMKNATGVSTTLMEVIGHKPHTNSQNILKNKVSKDSLDDFVINNTNLYIYGIESYFVELILYEYSQYKSHFCGFIVSDGRKSKDSYKSLPIYEVGKADLKSNACILVALGYNNSVIVQEYLKNYYNVLYLWEELNN